MNNAHGTSHLGRELAAARYPTSITNFEGHVESLEHDVRLGLPTKSKTRYRESQLLAEKLNYLSDIRKIELKMSCATTILSRERLRLHVETDWILLSPETYASWNAP